MWQVLCLCTRSVQYIPPLSEEMVDTHAGTHSIQVDRSYSDTYCIDVYTCIDYLGEYEVQIDYANCFDQIIHLKRFLESNITGEEFEGLHTPEVVQIY